MIYYTETEIDKIDSKISNNDLKDIGAIDDNRITTYSSYITNVEAYVVNIGKLVVVNIRFNTTNAISAGATLFQNLPPMHFTNQTLDIVNIANFSKGTVKLTGGVSLSSVDALLSGATYIITGLYI